MTRAGVRLAIGSLVAATMLVPSRAAVADESPTAEPRTAPTVDIVAPVVDIELATSDLQGAARVEEQDERIKVTLSSEVLFGKDSAVLRGQARSRLGQIAEQLQRAGPGTVEIIGYTDDLGSAQHGLVLSRQRARSVSSVLRPLLGRRDYPFTVQGKGEADPAVPNTSEQNRRLNRRVELTYRPD